MDYPCKWPYKVIGSDQALIQQEISAKLEGVQFDMNVSNQSKKGKYVSILVEVHVRSEKERIGIFDILKGIPTVRVVL